MVSLLVRSGAVRGGYIVPWGDGEGDVAAAMMAARVKSAEVTFDGDRAYLRPPPAARSMGAGLLSTDAEDAIGALRALGLTATDAKRLVGLAMASGATGAGILTAALRLRTK
jgi:hypothetical protein